MNNYFHCLGWWKPATSYAGMASCHGSAHEAIVMRRAGMMRSTALFRGAWGRTACQSALGEAQATPNGGASHHCSPPLRPTPHYT